MKFAIVVTNILNNVDFDFLAWSNLIAYTNIVFLWLNVIVL